MKHLLPVAVGLVVTAGLADFAWVTPAHAADETTNDAAAAQTSMPVENSTESTPTSHSNSGASHSGSRQSVALNFEPPQSTDVPVAPVVVTPASPPDSTSTASAPTTGTSRDDLFAGGSKSVVARTVGAAEGTRSADGGTTDIYEGHVDPGNGVWNRGTFSYQFGNEENLSAEEADRRQMAKIKRIYESVMLSKAAKHGVMPLTVAEEINGIDMINQAPLAVTEDGGYIERLAEARKKGLSGQAAILEARVWAFWDASRGGWDAPGLRAYDDMGKEASIRHDQKRRMGMIEDALASYQQQHGAIAERPQTDQKVASAQSEIDKPESSESESGKSESAKAKPAQTETMVASRPASPAPTQPEGEKRADLIIFGAPTPQDMPVAIAQR